MHPSTQESHDQQRGRMCACAQVCMDQCVHADVQVNTQRAHAHTHPQVCVPTRVHTDTHRCVYPHAFIHTHPRVHTDIQGYTHASTRTHTGVCTHTCPHGHTRPHGHTQHTRVHTDTQAFTLPSTQESPQTLQHHQGGGEQLSAGLGAQGSRKPPPLSADRDRKAKCFLCPVIKKPELLKLPSR